LTIKALKNIDLRSEASFCFLRRYVVIPAKSKAEPEVDLDDDIDEDDNDIENEVESGERKPVDLDELSVVVATISRFLVNLAASAPFRNAGIGLSEWAALRALSEKGGDVTSKRIAKSLGVTVQRANQLTEALKAANCVTMTPAPEDNRKKIVALTDVGQAKLAQLNDELLPFVAAALGDDGSPITKAKKSLKKLSAIGRPDRPENAARLEKKAMRAAKAKAPKAD
jgi:DNA-binding MarR family transcriptional regulator